MRLLNRLTKYEDEPVSYPIDANPWLQSIGSTFGTVTVGDAPDLIETYTVISGVLILRLTGGIAGTDYRVPITFTAANGVPRATILEVSVAGVRPNTMLAPPAFSNIDGGNPFTNYGGSNAIDGGKL
jgi:hypothetical protein